MLDDAGCPHERIVAVDGDAILYENKMGSARTAWLHRQHATGRLKVQMVEGFPAFPPAGWPD